MLRKPSSRGGWAALSIAVLVVSGCFFRAPRTYEKELDRVEHERQQSEEQQQLAHTEAQRYAAVVYFADGSTALDADAARELAWFAERMQPYPAAVIEVQGFAGSDAAEAHAADLSDARARAVARFLAAHGIDASRLVVGGLSARLAVAADEAPKGRRSNRRVEVSVH